MAKSTLYDFCSCLIQLLFLGRGSIFLSMGRVPYRGFGLKVFFVNKHNTNAGAHKYVYA